MKLWYYRNHRSSARKNNNHTSNTAIQSIPSLEKPKVSTVDTQAPNITLESFDLMSGVQFKNLIEKHFEKNGYCVNRILPQINRVDFLIEKDNLITAIATKKTFALIKKSYINNVIQSAKMYESISSIMIITTSMYFMPQARQLAEENGIILWDREILKSQLGGSK